MLSNDLAISVSGLGKAYEIYSSPRDRLKQFLLPRLARLFGKVSKKYFTEFWALRDVSFDVKKGETVGIIGRNGSGKSTLLQLICGTLNPTTGSVQTNGRIAALLELGSGFNPEFTGRENVYMNAALLGLTRTQTDQRFSDIIEYADIGNFIDQPVKTYSSGMMVRLAFAVIVHVDADILIVDEALSVGDAFFTQKCMRFIRQFQANGGTLLFVSHDMSMLINICKSGIMLVAGGRPAVLGTAEALSKEYLSEIYDDPERVKIVSSSGFSNTSLRPLNNSCHQKVFESSELEKNQILVSRFRTDAESFGKGGAKIFNAGFFDKDRNLVSEVYGGESVCFIMSVHAMQRLEHPAFGIMIKDRLGQFIYTEGTDKLFRQHKITLFEGDKVNICYKFKMPILLRGQYTVNVALADGIGDDHIQHHWIHDAVKIDAVSSPLVHGISGLQDSRVSIELLPKNEEIQK